MAIDIHDIAAAELTKDIEVTFTLSDDHSKTATFKVNPLQYMYIVCTMEPDSNDAALVNVVANLYNYNQKAVAYFNK